jgi:hypothetical protein
MLNVTLLSTQTSLPLLLLSDVSYHRLVLLIWKKHAFGSIMKRFCRLVKKESLKVLVFTVIRWVDFWPLSVVQIVEYCFHFFHVDLKFSCDLLCIRRLKYFFLRPANFLNISNLWNPVMRGSTRLNVFVKSFCQKIWIKPLFFSLLNDFLDNRLMLFLPLNCSLANIFDMIHLNAVLIFITEIRLQVASFQSCRDWLQTRDWLP